MPTRLEQLNEILSKATKGPLTDDDWQEFHRVQDPRTKIRPRSEAAVSALKSPLTARCPDNPIEKPAPRRGGQ